MKNNKKFIVLYQKASKYLSVLLEDNKRFYVYYKKRFPKSFKYLPICKFLGLIVIFITIYVDYQSYLEYSFSMLEKESLTLAPPKQYSYYSFSFYFVIIIYELVLSIYITLNANSPVRNTIFQIGKHVARAAGASTVVAAGLSYGPVEPNVVSNFVHTKTPFGRGYDFEVGCFGLKVKGDLVSGALGNEDNDTRCSKASTRFEYR